VLTGVELNVLNGHMDVVNSVAFSRNGMWIVSGSDDCSVQVWDVSTGAEINVLEGHTKSVFSVAFSSDNMWIVSGSSDKTVWVWDVSTGAELNVLKGHTDCVNSVAFSGNSLHIVSGSYDESVQVWKATVNLVEFAGNDMQIVSCSDQFVELSSISHRPFAWNLTKTNWIVSSQEKNHLMWVPQGAVTEPSNILTISYYGVGFVDFQQSMIGNDWIGCYTP